LMAITFTELCIGLGLMRVSHVVMIAALIAIVDILPILGTGTVLVPWAIIELVVGRQIFGLMLLLLYAIILVVRNILEPKIVGYHIGLYPLVTLIAMYVGLQAFGAVGLFTFPITVIVIKHMHDTGRLRLWKD
ncbi:MAG: AI-2E family transporter, partial [Clostridia bacterium]|nr:AI-2E family transporter [Clostridia bacterium]